MDAVEEVLDLSKDAEVYFTCVKRSANSTADLLAESVKH